MQEYKTLNGTSYDVRTPDDLIKKLEDIRLCNERVRIFCGDPATGSLWPEEYGVTGRLGRSTGSVKIPLLINNARSSGGPAILDYCILRIDSSPGCTIWQAKNYKKPVVEVCGFSVCFNGLVHGICQSEQQADRLASFLAGERWAK